MNADEQPATDPKALRTSYGGFGKQQKAKKGCGGVDADGKAFHRDHCDRDGHTVDRCRYLQINMRPACISDPLAVSGRKSLRSHVFAMISVRNVFRS